MKSFNDEVKGGERFEFGKNWKSFLSTLNEEKIKIAESSLKEMLRSDSLRGMTFLDVGTGSGLFSLAARRLGANVLSFDYDPSSVACAIELRSRYFPDDNNWRIEEGSVLDKEFINKLGRFDIVYSWGVLHHTGHMWSALNYIDGLVKEGGFLFIAIYNDQGIKSKSWKVIKKIYCSCSIGRLSVTGVFFPYFFVRSILVSLINRENVYRNYKKNRGMSIAHDWVDWLGGYPFEVAKVEEIFNLYYAKSYTLYNIKTNCGSGNNQFVFKKGYLVDNKKT